jgi:hypothetical protein
MNESGTVSTGSAHEPRDRISRAARSVSAGMAAALAAALALVGFGWIVVAAPEGGSVRAPEGVWRGASTCTDRQALPACHDEIVVYEFTAGAKPGVVHWKADKVVDGQRQPMGESDLTYDAVDACWRAEIKSPRVQSVWWLTVDGSHMTGTARLLPGKQIVRKIDVGKD